MHLFLLTKKKKENIISQPVIQLLVINSLIVPHLLYMSDGN